MPKEIWKPGTLLAPIPAVMVTCGTMEKPSVLTVAWTGIINSTPAMTYISVRPTRHSYEIIKSSGEFVINLTTVALCEATDFCGVKSGTDTDKIKVARLAIEPASKVACPLLTDSPLSLECRVVECKQLGSHHMFIAEILAVDVNTALMNAKGKLDLGHAGLLAYAHGDYYELGKKVGSFGYSVRKKPLPTVHRKPKR